MIWIAPSEKDTATETLEERLWDAADQCRTNSGLSLGLIFLSFAEIINLARRIQDLRQICATCCCRVC